MIIRPEKESEFGLLYELVKTAFLTAKVSDGKEQDFAERLRAGENYVPELALVAEDGGNVVGHIMLTRTAVVKDGGSFEALMLGPISVAAESRGKGIGSGLVKESFKAAKEMGFKAMVLVGDPEYYERFGFKQADSFGIGWLPENIPAENVMACELVKGALTSVSGTVDFS